MYLLFLPVRGHKPRSLVRLRNDGLWGPGWVSVVNKRLWLLTGIFVPPVIVGMVLKASSTQEYRRMQIKKHSKNIEVYK